jgi:hypothetical protein
MSVRTVDGMRSTACINALTGGIESGEPATPPDASSVDSCVAPWIDDVPPGLSRGVLLPATGSAVHRARAAMAAVCADWALCELVNPTCDGLTFLDTVTLCVSELVTNAVSHPRWPRRAQRRVIVLHARETFGRLVVEVRDPDARLPVLALDESVNDPKNPIESHRGLRLVADLMDQWGGALWWSPLPLGGKTVAFELPTMPHRRDGP